MSAFYVVVSGDPEDTENPTSEHWQTFEEALLDFLRRKEEDGVQDVTLRYSS